jgi:hypothetical protein
VRRRIMAFHNSRHIKLRYGRIIFEGRQNILSLVFFGPADGSRFFEQFGGSLHEPNR